MSSLRFQRLAIDHLDGIARGAGFALDELSPHVNLIHGPNGSGKTLTGRAILELVWPAPATFERRSLAGTWQLEDDRWTVELEAGRPSWRRDGVPIDPPSLPPAESRAQHWLGLRELLVDDGRSGGATRRLAERVALELFGGYDLDAAANAVGCSPRPSRPRSLRQAFEQSRTDLEDVRSEARSLHERSSAIDELIERRAAARDADERRRRLDRALDHCAAADDLARFDAELAGFDDSIGRLRGDERERLEDLDRALEAARSEAEAARREREAAERAVAEAGFGSSAPTPEMLDAARRDAAELAEIDRERRAVHATLEDTRAEGASRARRLRPRADGADDDALDALGVAPPEALARYARERLEHRALAAGVEAHASELAAIEARLEADPAGDEAGSVETVRRGLDVLARWLAAGPPGTAPAGADQTGPLRLAAAVVAVLSVALAAVHHWAWSLGLAAAATFAWLARGRGPVTDDRSTHRRAYETLDLPDPRSWDAPGVQTMMMELTDRWLEIERRHRERERVEAERARLDRQRHTVESSAARLEEARAALVAELGIEIADERDDWLHVLGEHLQAWQATRARAEGLEAKLGALDDARRTTLERFNGRLEGLVDRPARDASAAAGLVESLTARLRAHREATLRAETATRDLDRARSEIDQVQERRASMLDALGLDESSAGLLVGWLASLDRYRELVRARDEARVRRDTIVAELGEDHPALTLDRSRIESDRDAASREAETLSEIERSIGALRQEIERAKVSRRIEDARRRRDRAAADLDEHRRLAEGAVAGHAIVEWLRAETADRARPAVLRRASDLFGRITRGRFELRVRDGDDGPAFTAWDTRDGIEKNLEMLSTGERVQMLLSVRIGFLEHEEGGIRAPLILDETLGTTDDQRAGAIIDAVIEIARAGRQVFALTAQADEVGKWVARVEVARDLELRVIDLARVRGLARSQAAPLVPEPPPAPAIPTPHGRSHAEYGRALDVPGLDPAQPAGATHLWHLFDEPEMLHALLVAGISDWGAFRSLVVRRLVEIDGLNQATIDLIAARGRAIDVAFDAWRIGRGRPVDRAALEASGAVSETFIDRVDELAVETGRDARRILESLEQGAVPRWRTASTEALRTWLENAGHLDDEDRLDADQIRVRVLESAAEHETVGDLGDAWCRRLLAGLPNVDRNPRGAGVRPTTVGHRSG